MGAVDSDQLVLILVVCEKSVHGTFEAQDVGITGNIMTRCEDLYTQQGLRDVLHSVVACGESQVNDQTQFLVLSPYCVLQLPGAEHIRVRKLPV